MYSFLKFSEVSESLSIPAFNSSVRVLPKACLMWFFIRLESAESLWELPHPTHTWITIPTKIIRGHYSGIVFKGFNFILAKFLSITCACTWYLP